MLWKNDGYQRRCLHSNVKNVEKKGIVALTIPFLFAIMVRNSMQKEELTQKEVADKMGISQSYISRLEKRIIKKLGNRLNAQFK